jgi:hypothetical protein
MNAVRRCRQNPRNIERQNQKGKTVNSASDEVKLTVSVEVQP